MPRLSFPQKTNRNRWPVYVYIYITYTNPNEPKYKSITTFIVSIVPIRLNQIHCSNLYHQPDLDPKRYHNKFKFQCQNQSKQQEQQLNLTATTFLPFVLLTSVFLIGLMGWCLHGWCTQRPKILLADKTAE